MTTTLNLLHQSPETVLTTTEMKLKILDLLAFFIKECIDALTEFYIKKNLSKFDPHVGETSCQIRAYMFFLISSKERDEHDYVNIEEKIKKFESDYYLIQDRKKELLAALDDIHSGSRMGWLKQLRLEQFLKENRLIFNISEETLLLMQSHFLTRFKSANAYGDTCINYEKICYVMGVTRKLSKKIVRNYQIKIADHSVKFIYDLWQELPEHKDMELLFSHFKLNDDDSRPVLPCYAVMKILISHMMKSKLPILIMVKRMNGSEIDIVPLFFSVLQNKFILSPLDTNSVSLDNPCMVIYGKVNYSRSNFVETQAQFIQRFIRTGLITILLANMADHPQYPGKKLSSVNVNPFFDFVAENENGSLCVNGSANFADQIKMLGNELAEMQLIANTEKCSKKNPFLFLINHIFCDSISNQLQIYEKNKESKKYPYFQSLNPLSYTYERPMYHMGE